MMSQAIFGGRKAAALVAERYTEPTLRALQFASQEAQLRGDAAISVSDLLAGLSYDEATRAERVGNLKANASYLRWLTTSPQLPPRSAAHEEIHPQLDSDAHKALSFAVLEADRDREYWIDSDHLLRGLLRFPNKADFALLKTELTLESARKKSRIDRETFLPDENPSLKVVQYLMRKHMTLWLPPAIGFACYLFILMQNINLTTPRR
jgi:ATP-dependent Clp protease ATP-binding subunit ClpA